MDFAAEIKRIRKALGMNQADFAAAIGARQGSVSKWEGGKEKPRSEALLRIQSLYESDQSHRSGAPFAYDTVPTIVDIPLVGPLGTPTEVNLRKELPSTTPILRLPQHPDIKGTIWAWSIPPLASRVEGFKPGQIVFSHNHQLDRIEDGERVIVCETGSSELLEYIPRYYGRSDKGLEWFTSSPTAENHVRLDQAIPEGQRERHGIAVVGVVFASFKYESLRQRFWDGVWNDALDEYSSPNF
ncbi:helix-turn-helix domain-containing protein [Aureimonas mangrovi]|uniref:helix-turn-helix domain-containing protein n=1 Tax=Aureimonas mangrovi TaxID=2758041 RepID=UPI00163D5039|nr:helix-turn-helix domain-containing protein [Aureimonas mangrovi]